MCCCLNDIFIRKPDFNGSLNVCQNKAFTGRFRVLLDRHLVLEEGIEWNKLQNGGFIISIPGWEVQVDTVIVLQFY